LIEVIDRLCAALEFVHVTIALAQLVTMVTACAALCCALDVPARRAAGQSLPLHRGRLGWFCAEPQLPALTRRATPPLPRWPDHSSDGDTLCLACSRCLVHATLGLAAPIHARRVKAHVPPYGCTYSLSLSRSRSSLLAWLARVSLSTVASQHTVLRPSNSPSARFFQSVPRASK
jgi:hypothetical protein